MQTDDLSEWARDAVAAMLRELARQLRAEARRTHTAARRIRRQAS